MNGKNNAGGKRVKMKNQRRTGAFAMGCLTAFGLAFHGAGMANRFRAEARQKAPFSPKLPDKRVFPADNPWNQNISKRPVAANSGAMIRSIGMDKPLHPDFGNEAVYGIPYSVVSKTQPKVPVNFQYAAESDPGPYPIPPDAPIEGGATATGDRHVLLVDRDAWKLYELFDAHYDGKTWRAGSGAIFDLNSNALRPAGWTSADAAGLPIFPGLCRYEEIMERHALTHALRFTCRRTRRAYLAPARHFASASDAAELPPMGLRVRLKASFDTSGFPPPARVILDGLKKYGMILADNGSDWFFSGTSDPRWDMDTVLTLRRVKGRDFEVAQ